MPPSADAAPECDHLTARERRIATVLLALWAAMMLAVAAYAIADAHDGQQDRGEIPAQVPPHLRR